MYNVQTSIDAFIERLKTRYPRDNPVLDLLSLIEMLREENIALSGKIIPKLDAKETQDDHMRHPDGNDTSHSNIKWI
jgi:hypothetical protein